MGVRIVAVLALACAPAAAADRPGAADWERGVRLYEAEEYRAAQEAFEQALVRDSDRSTYEFWLGLAIGRRAERMSGLRRLAALPLARRVRRHFERAVDLDGSNLDALEALQGFHLEAPGVVGGDRDEAAVIAGRIEAIDPARGAAAWALYFEAEGDLALAGERFARARELAPEDIGYLLGHAGFLARRGRHAESDKLFDGALERDPGNPDAWLAAGRAWAGEKRRSRYAQARELLERYLASPDRKPNSDPPSAVRKLLDRL